jgi:hypothetical protein
MNGMERCDGRAPDRIESEVGCETNQWELSVEALLKEIGENRLCPVQQSTFGTVFQSIVIKISIPFCIFKSENLKRMPIVELVVLDDFMGNAMACPF